jgi:hypothetical protein
MPCCAESGEILIMPREGTYRDLSEDPSPALEGDVISSFDSEIDLDSLGREGFGTSSGLRSRPFVLQVPERDVEDRLLELERHPKVAAATRNWRVSLEGSGVDIGAIEAFVTQLDLLDSLPPPTSPGPAHVGVIDSGVDPSAVCWGRLSMQQLNIVAAQQSVRSAPFDVDGHGTTIASIIHRIDPYASITSIRCFDRGPSALSDIVNGILLALLVLEPVDIFNLSLKIDVSVEYCPNCQTPMFGPSAERAMRRLFDHLRYTPENEPLFIAAAGNDGKRVAIPAALEGIVAVGSTGASHPAAPRPEPQYQDIPALFVVAPGGSRAAPVGWTGVMHQKPRFGTSFATAVVSGVAARLVSAGWNVRAEPTGAKGAELLQRLDPWLWRDFPGFERTLHGAGVLSVPRPTDGR